MPIFPGSWHTSVSGGHIVDQSIGSINNVANISLENGQTGIDILLEASSPDAVHDSSGRDYAPQCEPGTRKQHIEDFLGWGAPAVGTGEPLPLFWLKGMAGVGKSAIAQTCAKSFEDLGRLGATFFFSVNIRDNAEQFFPTIAYQLSTKLPEYRNLVDQKISYDKTIVKKTMAAQFKALIAEPFQELEKTGKGVGRRMVVIIDGLDECKSADDQCRIIEIITIAARDGVTPLCWAFFSRPEPHIEATFASEDIAQITYKISLPISDEANPDIELYLRSGFGNILRRRNIPVISQWPSDNDIETLVKASNGLFIYAATVLRDVDQAASPTEALRAACADTSHYTYHSPFAGLDAFYTLIMGRIPSDKLPAVLLLCMLLCDGASYPGTDIPSGAMERSNILGLSEIDFRAACNQLSAVLYIHDHNDSFDFSQFDNTDRPFQNLSPAFIQELRDYVRGKLGGSIYFYHKSFFDFLMSQMRSGTFCVQSPPVFRAYFERSLEVMLEYEESYHFQGSGEVESSFGFLVYVLNAVNPELALAHGVADSAYSLPWPYINELVNSMLKARAYEWAFDTCFRFGPFHKIEHQLMQRFACVDFRKVQQNAVMLYAGYKGFMKHLRWDCCGYCKFVNGTQLFRTLRNEFQDEFVVNKFIATTKRWEEYGIIEPYRRNPDSQLKSLVLPKSQGTFIFGLFRMGRGPKSIFWYWEINFKEQYYQDFMAADLAEGERTYREERFDLWPEEPWLPA